MKAILIYSWIAFFICLCTHVLGQTPENLLIEQLVEAMIEDGFEHVDFSELTERLRYYRKFPIDINKATHEQLASLMFLSPLQINAILRYREQHGLFIDLLEMQSIEELKEEDLRRLRLFITLHSNSAAKAFRNGSQELTLRYGQVLQQQKGFLKPAVSTKAYYIGSSKRMLLRYRYDDAKISLWTNMKKNAGEPFFVGGSTWDFYSASVFVKNVGKLSSIVAGDYELQYGQGLSLWSGLSFGKGCAIATIPKQDMGLKAHASTNGNLSFRGVAATIPFNKLSVSPFISHKHLDATLKKSNQQIGSLITTGLHRTPNELKNHGNVSQYVYGFDAEYKEGNTLIGAIAYKNKFSLPFEGGQYHTYNQYYLKGSSLTNIGLYYYFNWHNTYFFGELAHSLKAGAAFITGAITNFHPHVSGILLLRDYQKNYKSFYAQALSESTQPINERGVYIGLRIDPNTKIEINTYVDVFKFPWLKYSVNAPSKGYEFASQFTYFAKEDFKIICRYKLKSKQENNNLRDPLYLLKRFWKQSCRGEAIYKAYKNLNMKSHLEVNQYHEEKSTSKEWGYLVFHEFIYEPNNNFLGNFRISAFNAPSHNVCIYVFEHDVLYSYSAPSYQNKGYRFCATIKYSIGKELDLWLRYALTKYFNIDQIGSGLDLIQGRIKSDVKIQLRAKF